MGAAEEHSRPRVGTTGTAGPWNLIPVISLNGDVQVLARSVMVLVRTICSRGADLGPIGALRLKRSQERYAEQLERERRARSKLKKADKNQVPRTRRTRRTD